MRYEETPLPGVFVIECDLITDDRGGFARTWCRDEFKQYGLENEIAQCSISFNYQRGTLRGIHYQVAPHEEVKLVRVTRGAIYDVVVDLRQGSPTFRRWFAAELSSETRRTLYIPRGCAHGFQTICENTEIFYQISTPYQPSALRGVRWDDPAFGITWPLPVTVIHPRDASYAYQDVSL